MCGTIDPGHTCDEYLVLLAKSGMTPRNVAKRRGTRRPKPIWTKVKKIKGC
jgi:hypothetical protein